MFVCVGFSAFCRHAVPTAGRVPNRPVVCRSARGYLCARQEYARRPSSHQTAREYKNAVKLGETAAGRGRILSRTSQGNSICAPSIPSTFFDYRVKFIDLFAHISLLSCRLVWHFSRSLTPIPRSFTKENRRPAVSSFYFAIRLQRTQTRRTPKRTNRARACSRSWLTFQDRGRRCRDDLRSHLSQNLLGL